MSEAVKRALRTLGQLVVSGGLTALVNLLVGHLSPDAAVIWLAGWQVVVTYVHNFLEAKKVIPTVLKN